MADDSTTGFLHLLPTRLPQGMTATAVSGMLLPWHAPAYASLVGTTREEPPAPALAVSYEWPLSWVRTFQPIGKFEREWLYLRRYSADQVLATGTHAFGTIEPGSDPPDAVARTDGGPLGVESTALTLQDRRGVHALFRLFQKRILETDPVAFTRLVGHVVYIWFEDPDGQAFAKPPRKQDEEVVEALLQAIASYKPEGDRLSASAGVPESLAPLPFATTEFGATFYAVPLVGAAPSTVLYTSAGFELGLAHTTFLTPQTAWNEVRRLVASHDQTGVDLLLITAGGPNQHGTIFPSEEAVANFLLQHPIGFTNPPEHIKQIVLHSWMTGRATALYPQVAPVFGPLYSGMAPIHHPLTCQ